MPSTQDYVDAAVEAAKRQERARLAEALFMHIGGPREYAVDEVCQMLSLTTEETAQVKEDLDRMWGGGTSS